MEKYVDMKSPLTGGRVKEVLTTEVKEFRKEEFHVHVRYYVCEDTGEQFTTTEQDTLQFNDLYAQYRVKHGIPFPDEIKTIRKGYNLNYSQISRILGFGANQYAKYEAGEVPSESNGKMIAAIRDKNVLLNLLKGCKSVFQPSEYERILASILMSDEMQDEFSSLHHIIYTDNVRNLFNGYGNKSIPKLFDMVGYIVAKHGEVFPTKLNKLMFYSDFCNYRKSGQSISGLQYRALKFGPVPDHYATIYDNAPNLDRRLIEAHDMVSTLLSCQSDSVFEELSETEKASMDYVVEKLKPLSVSDIIERSHHENCWKENCSTNGYIPYDEAFNLQLI
jgi:putative zinc finger/helix-turn-helix YgiT family protein